MILSTTTKDFVKALAIFLLPFVLYINIYLPHDLDNQFWKQYQEKFFNTSFESLAYVELTYWYLTFLLLIWLKNVNDKHLYGVIIILTALMTNIITFPFPDYLTEIKLYWLSFPLVHLALLYSKKDFLHTISLKHQANPVNLLLIVIGILYICSRLEIFPYSTKELNLGFITIGSYGFQNFNIFHLVVIIKIYGVIAFLIWFLTEKKWWRYAILSPILLLVNQFYNSISYYHEEDIIDEFELYQSGPLLLTLLIALLLLAQAADNQERIKAFLRLQYQNIEHAVEQRFGKQQQNIEEKKQRLATKKDLSKKELANLKKELEEELKNLT